MTLRGLYAITPECADSAQLLERSAQALEGGVAVLQYRSKQADAARRLREARALSALCAARDTVFIVNDDVELAVAAGADGVHLGRDDGDPAAARARLPRGVIGVSCYDQASLAQRAVAQGADYVAFGSVFASPTKPAAVRAPLALFAPEGVLREDRWPRLPGAFHGSGCTLASALAALLALGRPLPDAAREAQDFTWQALEGGFAAGGGQAIPDRFFRTRAPRA